MATPKFDTNVDFNESRQGMAHAVAWTFTGIAVVAVTLKLFTRVDRFKKLGWDDFFITFSALTSIVASTITSYSVHLGLGRHTAAIVAEGGYEAYVRPAYWQVVGFPFNIASFSFPNISIAILIDQLLSLSPLHSRLLYGLVIMQVVTAMISVFIVFFQCNPPNILWDARIPGSCWSPDVFNGFQYFVSSWTTFTDIVLAAMPIMAFWKLQMRTSTKVGVCIMMAFTLLSAIMTIIKATLLHTFNNQTDHLYVVVPLVLWGIVEQNVVIIAACVPTLRPLFRKAFMLKSTADGTGSNSRSRSGSAFKMKKNPLHQVSRRLPTESETALGETYDKDFDLESNNQPAILQTKEFTVDVEDGRGLGSRQTPNDGPSSAYR